MDTLLTIGAAPRVFSKKIVKPITAFMRSIKKAAVFRRIPLAGAWENLPFILRLTY
jgi:hypothetical protein